MKRLTLHIIILAFFVPLTLKAQEDPALLKDKMMEEIAESLAEDTDENADLSSILEELQELMLHPVNINTVTREELEKLRFMNPAQIDNLLKYRKQAGQIFSLTELQLIDGFNEDIAQKLSLFTTIDTPEPRNFHYIKNEINLYSHYTVEKAAGFIPDEEGEKRFEGIAPRLLLKYKGEKDRKWSWGLTADNDPGEAFFSGNNKAGFDFYSGHIAWTGNKIVKQIIAGDYQVKTGQGLLFWSGYGARKSIDGMTMRYTGQGLRPYSSAAEYGFYRGIAASFGIGSFDLTTFYSNRNADANVTIYDSNDAPAAVSSILEMGYHRTENEIADKQALNIQTSGASLRYNHNRFSAALNGGWQKYNIPLEPDMKLYNQYYLRGTENYCFSADAQQALNNVSLFGEFAVSRSGGTALIAGADASPSSEIAFSVIYRDYKKDFHTLGGNPFSEFGTVSNERGIYSGVTLYAIPRVTINSYLDLYQSYWVKYTSLRPVKGTDFALQTSWALSKKVELQLRYKTETRNENSSLETPIKTDANETTQKIRFNAEWKPSHKINLRFRTEWSGISKEDSLRQGWLMFIDATTKAFDEKLTATARLAWFKTDDYSSGIRAYENDLPLNFPFPVYYLNGLRYYANLNYRLSKALTLYLKLSQTMLAKSYTSISSGDLEIEGNHKTEIKLQVRYKF